jgi:hypothetical protein
MLRMEDDGVSPIVGVLLALSLTYLTATPGVLQGFWDTYIVAPLRRVTEAKLQRSDVKIGAKIAEGGFGTVYLGEATTTVPGKVRKGDVRSRLSPLSQRLALALRRVQTIPCTPTHWFLEQLVPGPPPLSPDSVCSPNRAHMERDTVSHR